MISVSPAVKQETTRIAIGCAIGAVLMWLIFFVLHQTIPQQVPFDYTVILGGIGGVIFAVLNFFLMGLTVQKVASQSDQATAKQHMHVSQRQRALLMLIWGIAALAAPCFNGAAAIIPLLFPSTVIKIYYLAIEIKKLAGKGSESK